MGYGTCHEFSGPGADDLAENACSFGILGDGCPGGAIGVCDLGNIGTHPPGYVVYHYECFILPDVETSQSTCTDMGGSWSPG
jgi:hypothetical protein